MNTKDQTHHEAFDPTKLLTLPVRIGVCVCVCVCDPPVRQHPPPPPCPPHQIYGSWLAEEGKRIIKNNTTLIKRIYNILRTVNVLLYS